MECEFCKNKLKNLSSLNFHKKNNKKCLDIQNKINDNVNSALVKCEFCDKCFSLSTKQKHLIICKEKHKKEIEKLKEQCEKNKKEKDEEIERLRNEIRKLKDYIIKLETENNIYKNDRQTINDIAKQNNTNNNIVNKLCDYEEELIIDR
jgi:seryl-tRNA synthetase